MRARPLLAAALLVALATSRPYAQQGGGPRAAGGEVATEVTVLTPTPHPPMPRELSLVWLAPDRGVTGRSSSNAVISNAAKLLAGGEYAKAYATVAQPAVQQGPLAHYVTYYTGVSQLHLDRPADALRTFAALSAQKPVGYLSEAALFGEADAQLALNKPGAAIEIYERLLKQKPSSIEDVLMRLGRAAKAAGDASKAADAFGRVYYEFALGESARAAGSELALLHLRDVTPGSQRFQLELGRAQRLYASKQYREARDSFDDLKSLSRGDDKEVIELRIAQCDYYLKKTRAARDVFKAIADERDRRQAEALYFYAVAQRDLGDAGTFLAVARRIVTEFPGDTWAQEALNALGTYYILRDEDEQADAIFRELYEQFPTGPHAERAAWKAGWRAYRQGQYEDTVRFFERASADFSRSDFRPSWIYWAARAHEKLSNKTLANLRYAIVVADYMNSYYGRLSAERLGASAQASARAASASLVAGDIPLPSPMPANTPIVKALLGAEMFGDALNELRYARRAWGDSSAIQATVAWVNQQQARDEKGMERFQLMRGGINNMRRAYPQFMTAEGEELPHDVLTVIYPLAYWDLIRKYSAQYDLDPYLVAALVLQESTFVADVRSHANAYGLMQLMPATARQYARKLGIPYSSRLLTNPDANIRMGTAYFSDKIKEFGGVHLALASYNAGERPVRKWMAERQGVEREEFIDDIPYPETQGYVRKIMGMAHDYKRLYGGVDATGNSLDKTPDARVTPAPVAAPSATVKPAPKAKAPAKKPAPKPRTAPAGRARSRA